MMSTRPSTSNDQNLWMCFGRHCQLGVAVVLKKNRANMA
jgi:hypothetical protein